MIKRRLFPLRPRHTPRSFLRHSKRLLITPGTTLSDDQMKEITAYYANDVNATEELYFDCLQKIKVRHRVNQQPLAHATGTFLKFRTVASTLDWKYLIGGSIFLSRFAISNFLHSCLANAAVRFGSLVAGSIPLRNRSSSALACFLCALSSSPGGLDRSVLS